MRKWPEGGGEKPINSGKLGFFLQFCIEKSFGKHLTFFVVATHQQVFGASLKFLKLYFEISETSSVQVKSKCLSKAIFKCVLLKSDV